MKIVIISVIAAILISGCQSGEGIETASIQANTMVCGMCEKTVKKAVFAVEGVKDVIVDGDKKFVKVKYVPAQTNLATIERAITEVGYDANDEKRDADAYEKLDECCKID